jgi:hypothetical protein
MILASIAATFWPDGFRHSAQAATYQWKPATAGFFENPSNWTILPGNTPATMPPGAGDDAQYVSATVTFSGSSDVTNTATIFGTTAFHFFWG